MNGISLICIVVLAVVFIKESTKMTYKELWEVLKGE
jgi:hypothetical protein